MARLLTITFLLLAFGCFSVRDIGAQSTVFTYQGSLKDGANPANGNYDFEFALYDSLTGGTQVGGVLSRNSVAVSAGIFAVSLDFGNQFPGSNRFLEIRVRQSGGGGLTTLSPRQMVNSSPYSLKSQASDNATIATVASNALNLGGVPASQFTVNGQSVINAGTQFNIGGARVFSIAGTDNVFAGFGAGQANTTGNDNAFFGSQAGLSNMAGGSNVFVGALAGNVNVNGTSNTFVGFGSGVLNVSGTGNTFLGLQAGGVNTTGTLNVAVGTSAGGQNRTGTYDTFIGTAAGSTVDGLQHATAIGGNATVSTNNTIVLGRADASDTVDVPGKLQVDTLGTAGSTSLCLNGSNRIAGCSSSLRYKTNIGPFGSGLDLIRRLHPITFDWKDGGMHDLGLGAEDVAAVEPLLVTHNAKGEVEGVKYDRIAVVLINAVDEQQTQITKQQDELKRLKNEINSLKSLVCTDHPTAAVCKARED